MIRIIFSLALGIVLTMTAAKAQVQLMPSVGVLVYDANTFRVVSISGRYFISSHVAAGINIRYVPALRIPLATLEADYFFSSTKSIRPFFGLEAGSFSEYRRALYYTRGIAPKVGVQGRLSSLMGVQLEISRPVAIKKGERFGADTGTGFLVGIGLNFALGANR
jgi:hypothetical protein